METHATPQFVIGQMRVLTISEMSFFHVSSQPIPFSDLDKVLDPLLENLYAAKAQANLIDGGPDVTRYYRISESDLYQMEVGVSVKPGTQPAGDAKIKTLAPLQCAGLLLWGSLAHIAQAYSTLTQTMKDAGMQHTGECQEWNYYFESVDSPNNVMGIYMGIR